MDKKLVDGIVGIFLVILLLWFSLWYIESSLQNDVSMHCIATLESMRSDVFSLSLKAGVLSLVVQEEGWTAENVKEFEEITQKVESINASVSEIDRAKQENNITELVRLCYPKTEELKGKNVVNNIKLVQQAKNVLAIIAILVFFIVLHIAIKGVLRK